MFSYDFNMRKFIIIVLFVYLSPLNSNAASLIGRLGIGMTNQVANGITAISMKIQQSRSSAIGGLFALDSSSSGVLYALGLKGYKYIYEEPQLNFYSSLAANTFTYLTILDEIQQGYQIDATFGAEFNFQGLESIGFSFEFGMGYSKVNDDAHFKTLGYNTLASAIHFYL